MRRCALALLLVAVPAAAQAQFRDETTGLVISPPEYMYRQGEDLLAPQTLISCWYAPATDEYPWVKLCAERLDRLPKADEKLDFQWRDRTVRGSRVRTHNGTEEVMLFSALLPLHLSTVRVDVVTPVSGADEGKAVMEETLASVTDVGRWIVPRDGQTRSAERSDEYESSDKYVARLVGKVGTILLISGIGMWIRQRRARKKAESEGEAVTA